ncbi:MAG: SDR family NAD(P)-dependent oxidoreductase [Syntrophales bacterium]
MDIRKAVAIVTGSSSVTGVGAETAKLLASHGAKVVINYATNKAGAEETAQACFDAGGKVKGDVAKDEDCRRLVRAAMDRWGRLDILVNNAATTKAIAHRNLDELNADEFQRTLSVNLIGNYQMTRAAFHPLKSSGDGAVVNISSNAAFHARGSSIAYAASKGALNTMTVSFARLLAPEVRVNTLCPGGVFGNKWTRKIYSDDAYEKRITDAKNKFPLARPVWPVDVADAVLWLCVGARSMTGETIRMDSGQHLL